MEDLKLEFKSFHGPFILPLTCSYWHIADMVPTPGPDLKMHDRDGFSKWMPHDNRIAEDYFT